MGLQILEDKCTIGENQGKIVIQTDEPDGYKARKLLENAETRRLAQQFAASKGLSQPGINGTVQIYPVDIDGKEITNPKKQKIAFFYAEVPIQRSIM